MVQYLLELNIPHEMFWWQIQTRSWKEWKFFVHERYKTKMILSRLFISIYNLHSWRWRAITVARDEGEELHLVFNLIAFLLKKGGKEIGVWKFTE
jgi:hypothetical protein